MNPAFLRLAITGNRNAVGRLIIILVGIAMGMAMIVLLAGAFSALTLREERSAWVKPVGDSAETAVVATGDRAVLARVRDWFEGKSISRVDVFAPANAASSLAALPAWPRAGEYYASPAMARLIDATPADRLGARYGTRIGLIDDVYLKGPDSLVVVAGKHFAAMQARIGLVYADTASSKSDMRISGYQTIAAIGAIGMLFPILLFIAIATRLGAASRQETFSTLRLVGATRRQIGMIAGLETLLVSIGGTALGMGLAALARPVAARFEALGASFYPADLDIGLVPSLVIAAIIVVTVTLVSTISMWRAAIGPLGATRAIAEKPVHWRRGLILIAGFALITIAGSDQLEAQTSNEIASLVFLAGFALVTLGIIVIGPWLTAQLGKLIARTANSASGVIVANRIAQAPVATFRSVSGLVLAVFLVTVFSAASSGVSSRFLIAEAPNHLPVDALFLTLAETAEIPDNVPGTSRIIVGYETPSDTKENGLVFKGADFKDLGIDVPSDADSYYRIDISQLLAATMRDTFEVAPFPVTAHDLTPKVLIARTNGPNGALETARTALQTGTQWILAPMTRIETSVLGNNRVLKEISIIAYSGALITIILSGVSLTVSTLGAIVDRKRVFGLLRLIGMPARILDRVVFMEAATPLAAVLAFAIMVGYLGAYLIVRTLSGTLGIGAPDLTYFAFIATGLISALLILQISKRVTHHLIDDQATRFE